MLSDDDSASSRGSDIHQITVNEHFAKAYKAKKEHEELQKLKDKYGSDAELDEDEEDSEEETEDEDGDELTPAIDVAMLRTLAKIRSKDPSIYDSKKNIFEEEQQTTGEVQIKRKRKDTSKPLTIRQHALNSMLEGSRSPSPSAPMTYAREQELLKKETVQAFKDAAPSDEESDSGDLLVPRERTKDEIEREEEEYKEFLQREVGNGVDIRELITVEEGVERIHESGEGDTTMSKKRKRKEKEPKEKRSEETDRDFLLNYILNRGWVDKSSQRVPTYHEVTGSKPTNGKQSSKEVKDDSGEESAVDVQKALNGSDSDLVEEEDSFDDLNDRFESSYNFRFEEPGAATIATHPRTLPSLVRRPDTTRKEAREKRKKRKEEEKAQKKEEVKRLKALKMKEIRSKIEQIEKEGGKGVKSDALKGLEDELDGEWDPEKYDRKMREVYDEAGFYEFKDEEKPEWEDAIDITDIVGSEKADNEESSTKKRKRKKKKETIKESAFGEVDEEQMDAEIERDWEFERAQWDGTEESRKLLMDKYMDEVYGLEFNDMIGDMPTRFKYTSVPSTSYALSPVEILMATDKELNQYVSIKKFAPYRKNKGNWDKDRNEKLKELKAALAHRTWDGMPVEQLTEGRHSTRADGVGEGKKKKRMGKKERMKLKSAAAAAVAEEERVDVQEEERPKKKRKKNPAEA